MKKIVIGLSGGMDSVTLLGLMLEQGFAVHCVSFLYGSKHSPYETEAAINIIEYYSKKGFNVKHYIIDIKHAFTFTKSNLLEGGGKIPEGHYEAESMKQTIVPGRNLILGAIMASLAESIGAEYVMLGVHAGDHHIYPDCREDFIKSFDKTVQLSTDGKVKVRAPMLLLNKARILEVGHSLKTSVPYHLTRTCYKNQSISCGKCGSCQERLEAFAAINKLDLIPYEQ